MSQLHVLDVDYSLNESNVPDPSPGAAGLWLGITNDNCYTWRGQTSWPDVDTDGLADYCEVELARAFAPMLAFADGESCSSGEPYWLAKVIDNYWTGTGDLVRLGYLTAYHTDCGIGGHLGDSEFVQETVEYDPATHHWILVGGWLSEHACADPTELKCGILGGLVSGSYGWIHQADFEYPGGRFGSYPRIYASLDKHANYENAAECDDGGPLYLDTCEGATDVGRFNVIADRNLGSAHHPLVDCVLSYSGISELTGTECFWSGTHFWGWHFLHTGTGAGPYTQYTLNEVFQSTMISADVWWAGSYGY